MDGLFSQWVATDAWRDEATTWIGDELAAVGRQMTGEVEQRRIRSWSTQLVVPTDRGTVWFKGNCPALAFEPAVHRALASLEPDEVDDPLAIDDARGWMMTADRGATLGDSRDATLEDWQAVVRLAATLQRRVAGEGSTLRRAGLPDCSPSTVPARYQWLIEQLAALPGDHPSHLTDDVRAELEAGVSVVEDAVETLSAARLPVTLQHGDLHPRNVFAVGSSLRMFDFGDAQWAHALEMLAVPYGYVTRLTTHPWPAVLSAYAQVWSDVIDPVELETLMTPAMVTHAVNRSFTWLGSVVGAQPHELAEWGDSPLYYLKLALQPFPPEDPEQGP
ncbi:MAG: phosphotransferase [Pedococcus sp.]